MNRDALHAVHETSLFALRLAVEAARSDAARAAREAERAMRDAEAARLRAESYLAPDPSRALAAYREALKGGLN